MEFGLHEVGAVPRVHQQPRRANTRPEVAHEGRKAAFATLVAAPSAAASWAEEC